FLGSDTPFTTIEITQQMKGYPPKVLLYGDAALQTPDNTYPISISHDAGIAVAIAAEQSSPTGKVRVGADITETARVKSDIQRRNTRVLRRIFSEQEL